jgi:glycosyltransferase involved in cell wall biosynthesis
VPLNVVARAAMLAEESAAARAERRRAARQALAGRHSLGARPIVLALGRLHPFKAIDRLVEAIASLPNADLVIAGPSLVVRPFGDTATALAALARRFGVADRVHVLGRIPPVDALDLLAGADVLAVPSHLESMNRVCVEAAAVGTPFVVTETTGIAGWLRGPGVGTVVANGDSAALVAALDEATDGRFRRDDDRAREFVGRFAPARVAADLASLYEPLVAARR